MKLNSGWVSECSWTSHSTHNRSFHSQVTGHCTDTWQPNFNTTTNVNTQLYLVNKNNAKHKPKNYTQARTYIHRLGLRADSSNIFQIHVRSVWNSLPTALRMSDCSLTTFRTQLKTLLFIWYIVYRQQHFLTAGQRICSLLEGILRATNSLNNNNNNLCLISTAPDTQQLSTNLAKSIYLWHWKYSAIWCEKLSTHENGNFHAPADRENTATEPLANAANTWPLTWLQHIT